MTSLCSVLICLVLAKEAQPGPQGFAAAALGSTPYYRQQEAARQRSDPAHDRADEILLANSRSYRETEREREGRRRDDEAEGRTFESADRADEHFGRAFQRGELPEHVEHLDKLERFERAFQRPESPEEDDNQMRRSDFNHRRRQPALLDDPRRTVVHGWEAPHGKWEHRERVGEHNWEHRAGAPHRAETMAAQIGDRGEVRTPHSMVERALALGEHGEHEEQKALALLGEHESAESEGIFGALKEGFESMYTTITITDYPYFCPCSWAKTADGKRQQLTMKEGGKCISAANEPCAKQSAGRVGLLLLAAVLVGRE